MLCIYVNNYGFKSLKLFYNIPSYYHFSKLAIKFPINGLLDVISVAGHKSIYTTLHWWDRTWTCNADCIGTCRTYHDARLKALNLPSLLYMRILMDRRQWFKHSVSWRALTIWKQVISSHWMGLRPTAIQEKPVAMEWISWISWIKQAIRLNLRKFRFFHSMVDDNQRWRLLKIDSKCLKKILWPGGAGDAACPWSGRRGSIFVGGNNACYLCVAIVRLWMNMNEWTWIY